MNKQRQLILAAICFFISLSVCFGESRIISLGPTVTKELYILGVGDSVVGDTTYCNYPEAAKTKVKVGDITNSNLEKIISLKPTLIFTTDLSNKNQVEQLKKLKIAKLVNIGQPNSYEVMCQQFIQIGDAVGKGKLARKIIAESQARVSSLKEKTDGLKKTTVFIQIGANPLFTVNKESFINDFIAFGGG